MINTDKITLGSDPEFAFVNSVTGKAVSAHGLIGGTKKQPTDIGEGCGKQEDGVMAELTIPPCSTEEEFVYYIMYGKNYFNNIIKKVNPHYECVSLSSQHYNSEDLQAKEVREFGCDPSYCIYTSRESVRPSAEEVGDLRSAGFHIHIGVPTHLDIPQIENLIFLMDVFCGLPSVLTDGDMERKRLYGNAGDFRFKYLNDQDITLVEYRTLGGANHRTPEHIAFFYQQTMAAVRTFNDIEDIDIESMMPLVRKAIDTSDKDLAISLMEKFNITLPQNLITNDEHSSIRIS